jgi:5-methylcytosine-specific restriction enzyme A
VAEHGTPRRGAARHGFYHVRKVPAWQGKTDDVRVPLQVQLRILVRQHGRCAISGHKFTPGDAKRLDHIVPLADGGLHREENLQWILDVEHKLKTKAEAEVRARVRSVAARHAGLERPGKVKIRRRPKPEKAPLRVAGGKTAIARRFGL